MKIHQLEVVMSAKVETLQSVREKIFNCYSILRGTSIGLDNYHVILFLLSLYRDKIISREFIFDKGLLEFQQSGKVIMSSFNDLNSNYEKNCAGLLSKPSKIG